VDSPTRGGVSGVSPFREEVPDDDPGGLRDDRSKEAAPQWQRRNKAEKGENTGEEHVG
jgi:hypothetical protein